MKSAREQAFWVGYGLAMVLLIGGAGYYLFTALGGYAQSSGEFQRQKVQKKKLESAAIYPNAANLEKLKTSVTEFEVNVNTLHDDLKSYQQPLPVVTDQQFPQELKAMIEAFRKHAFEKRVDLPEDFYFGMNEYASTLPKPGATGILKYQLDSMDYLLRTIIAQGSDEIISVEREQMAVEKTPEAGQEVVDPEKTERVAKYPIKISFVTGNDGFRNFLNLVSNDKKYFYIVRVVRVDNEVKVGPPKNVEAKRLAKDPTTGEVIEVTEGQDPKAAGLQEYDARILFGNEKLRVTAVIDLCRFPEIADTPPPPPAPPSGRPMARPRPAAPRS